MRRLRLRSRGTVAVVSVVVDLRPGVAAVALQSLGLVGENLRETRFVRTESWLRIDSKLFNGTEG